MGRAIGARGHLKATDAIVTSGLTKAYGGVEALRDLDIRVPAGAVVGFLGPNGAGKTTAIKLLLGLIRPTRGSGTVFGLDLERDGTAIRQRVGYLSQRPVFDSGMSAREVVELSASFYGIQGAFRRNRAAESLALVGLTGLEDRRVRGFSGGELQRLGIAQAWVARPDLLILDEPASALDPVGRADVLNIIANLRGTSTVFFSTHILDDVQRTSDFVIILRRGSLVAQGSLDELLRGQDQLVLSLVVAGDVDRARAAITALAAVGSVDAVADPLGTRLRVTMADPAGAPRLLPAVVALPGVEVREFTQNRRNLEDVFIDLVQD